MKKMQLHILRINVVVNEVLGCEAKKKNGIIRHVHCCIDGKKQLQLHVLRISVEVDGVLEHEAKVTGISGYVPIVFIRKGTGGRMEYLQVYVGHSSSMKYIKQ